MGSGEVGAIEFRFEEVRGLKTGAASPREF
jgi:hypothetical protein